MRRAKQDCSVKTKKMEPIIGIDEEGASPSLSISPKSTDQEQYCKAGWVLQVRSEWIRLRQGYAGQGVLYQKRSSHYRNRRGGRSPTKSLNAVKARAYKAKSRSKATATSQITSGSGAILQSRVGFASEKRVECTYVLDTSGERSKARSCEARLLREDKKNGANYRNRQDGRSPAQSRSGATATDNKVRIA